MARKLAAWTFAIVLLAAMPSSQAHAQSSKATPIVAGNGSGSYGAAARAELTGALDRATGELDATGARPTPDEVKDASFRRRLLELRLLMDLNSFAYNHDQMKGYRDTVDNAYGAIGEYQDLSVIQKLLNLQVNPDVVAGRLAKMNESLAPLRSGKVRNEMRGFFAAPNSEPRQQGAAPRLWDLATYRASSEFDGTGNAALLQSGILHSLQNRDLSVTDIFDPPQEARFHAVRKDLRSMLLLAAMFPDTNAAIQDALKPLDDLVDQYGDVTDAYTAYVYTLQAGIDHTAAGDNLYQEFLKATERKNAVVETHALDQMDLRVSAVMRSHRR